SAQRLPTGRGGRGARPRRPRRPRWPCPGIPALAGRERHTDRMPSDAAATWDRISAWYQREARSTTDAVQYLDSGPTDSELRLCGDVSGRRVLDLGCGGGQNAIAFARAGARVIG